MIQEVSKAIEQGSYNLIKGLIYDALDAGDAPKALLNEDMIPAICAVFQSYHEQDLPLSALQRSITTLRKGVDALKPYLGKECISTYGRCAISSFATHHKELGKDLITLICDCLGLTDRMAFSRDAGALHRITAHRRPDRSRPDAYRFMRAVPLTGSPERININAYEEVIS